MKKLSALLGILLLLFFSITTFIFKNVPSASAQNPTIQQTQKNWHVFAGKGGFNNEVAVVKFYPETITVNEGDSITWTVEGDAHTVSFLSGATPPAPLDPQALTPAGGNSYDGTGFISSGLLEPGQSYTLTFTKQGSFDYSCLIHPGMNGKVIVQNAGSPYPQSQSQIDRQFNLQGLQDVGAGLSLLNTVSPFSVFENADGTKTYKVSAGVGNGTESIMRFIPEMLLVQQGDTITWTNEDVMMPHTVTFPGPDGVTFDPPDPRAFQKSGGDTFDGSTLTSSGIIFPHNSYSLKFTKAGNYNYECLFHDELGMRGRVFVLRRI